MKPDFQVSSIILRVSGAEWLHGDNVSWAQQDSCTQELSLDWQHAQNMCKLKPDKNPCMERGGGHETPSIAKQLLAIVRHWRRESQLSQEV